MVYHRLAIEWLLVLVAASALVIAATRGGWTASLDVLFLDFATSLRRPPPNDQILLVEIDDASLAAIGRWPWPRSVHAAAIDRIAAAHPAAIGYDVLFLEPAPDDAVLATSIARARTVFLPILPALTDGGSAITGVVEPERQPPTAIAAAVRGLGGVDVAVDDDGVVRRFDPRRFGATPHVGELIVRSLGAPVRHAVAARDSGIIRFQTPGSLRRVSFADVAAGRVPAAFLRDKIVLVGATAPGLGDRFVVPPSAGTMLSGVELQANVIDGLMRHDFDRPVAPLLQLGMALAAVWSLLLAFLRFGPATNLRLSIGLSLAVCAGSVLVLGLAGRWFAPGATLLTLVVVHSLWGWRRLAAVSRFLVQQVNQLQAEPDILLMGRRAPVGEDEITVEIDRLDNVIGQLRGMRRFVADVLARLPDAVCVTGPDDRVVMGNRNAEALFGGPVKGLGVAELLARLGLAPHDIDGEVALRDGRSLVISRTPAGDDGTILRFVDVTELKAAGRARDEALQFLSHDMRAPLASVIALLRDQVPASTTNSDANAIVLRHARRGLDLADNFVQLAKMQSAPLACEQVDLASAAAEAVDLVWPQSQARDVPVEEIGFDTEIVVEVDAAALQRALVNLLDNAIKFAAPRDHVQCWIEREGDMGIVTVTGPGPALPPERIGDPFAAFAPGARASSNSGTGHGLGLAFVKTFAQRHGGSATYRAEAGPLKSFSIRLPIIDE